MNTILITALVLGAIGVTGAVVLYVALKRFRVEEDERIGRVEALLPGANCGACGCNGCHDFAVKCCSATSLENYNCPGAGAEAMKKIAAIVGLDASAAEPKVAVLKCAGARSLRRQVAVWDGVSTCEIISNSVAGCWSCPSGCVGCGDCVKECRFGALRLNDETHLPEIDVELCTGCAQCVTRCPKGLLEMQPRRTNNLKVWVACSNRQRGADARRGCSAACIGCGKCEKACPFDAVHVVDNLAYVDPEKCRLCRKCVAACPTGAIHTANFPVPLPTAVMGEKSKTLSVKQNG